MPPLNELKKELRFSGEFLQLIQTLKNIAASQYHLLEKEKERFDEFMLSFADFFRVVNLVDVDNPLVRRISDVLGIVVVTSDSGFMGGLNAGVIDAAVELQGTLPDDKVHLIVIGEKGAANFADRRRPFKYFPGIVQETRYEQALEIRDYVLKEMLAGRVGKVSIAYPRPVSFTQQTIETANILPCAELFDHSTLDQMTDSEAMTGHRLITAARRVIVESSFGDMVEYLSGMWAAAKLYEVFEDAKLAEFSARAIHLEDSAQKLEKNLKKLRHQCFRAAHELVDKGMRESFASRKKKKRAAA